MYRRFQNERTVRAEFAILADVLFWVNGAGPYGRFAVIAFVVEASVSGTSSQL